MPDLEIAKILSFKPKILSFFTKKIEASQNNLSFSKVYRCKPKGNKAENLSYFRIWPEFLTKSQFFLAWAKWAKYKPVMTTTVEFPVLLLYCW